MEAAVARGADKVGPKSNEFVKKIHARPAYKKALERGGEYSML